MEFEHLMSNQNYRPIRKIGSGAFGKIYLAENLINGQRVALKLENKSQHSQLLKTEYRFYNNVYYKGVGIPEVYDYFELPNVNVLAMELLGPSLEDLFRYCSGRFTLKTVLMLAQQMISRVEHVHENHVLHRDIKPDNFAMGPSSSDGRVYILDFGLAKSYRDLLGKKHIELTHGYSVTGTTRYGSVNSLLGYELSRRDDMVSLGYVFVYLLRGRLPWQGITGPKKQRIELITEKKLTIKPEELCNEFPDEFAAYLTYCRNLEFKAKPNYCMLRTKFVNLYMRLGYVNDNVYDWHSVKTLKESKRIKIATEDDDKENQQK